MNEEIKKIKEFMLQSNEKTKVNYEQSLNRAAWVQFLKERNIEHCGVW